MSLDRILLGALLILSAGILFAALYGYFFGRFPFGKLLNSLSIMLGLASMFQLKIVGWFDVVISEFGDEQKYPYGPPSYITRQIIDNPDTPIRTSIRNYFFFDANFGFHLAVASLLIALLAIWLD